MMRVLFVFYVTHASSKEGSAELVLGTTKSTRF